MPIVAADIVHRNSKSGASADGEASPDGLGGYMSSEAITDDTVENLFDNVTSAESEAGATEYRAMFILNDHGSLTYEAVRAWLEGNYPMCLLTTQLESGGSEVTVYVDDNSNFPDTGAFFVEDEEIAYTGKSGSTSFTGCTRGSNSTSKVQHTVGTACEHNKISFDIEDPGGSGNPIQTIADESTAPTGLAGWSQARTYADGKVIGDLAAGEKYGIWIKRQVPVGCQAKSGIYVKIRVKGDTAE
jgi:hypothetical protein